MQEHNSQRPVSKRAETLNDLLEVVTHPAFRIGFLDAQKGRDFDHDNIMVRIEAETPLSALSRIGWTPHTLPILVDDTVRIAARVELAQYRYEEGRLLVKTDGLRCKAWGHPDYPPKAVWDFVYNRATKLTAQEAP